MDENVKKYEAIRHVCDLVSQSLEDFSFAHELLKRIVLEGNLDLTLDGLELAENQFRKAMQTQLDILETLDRNL
jgi:hypothetical protein